MTKGDAMKELDPMGDEADAPTGASGGPDCTWCDGTRLVMVETVVIVGGESRQVDYSGGHDPFETVCPHCFDDSPGYEPPDLLTAMLENGERECPDCIDGWTFASQGRELCDCRAASRWHKRNRRH